MKIEELLSDEVILKELGERFARRRLDLQMSQEILAEQAGVSKRTVERFEAGMTTQLPTMIRMLRVLKLLDRLETLVPEVGLRPMELVKLRGKMRKRAGGQRTKQDNKPWTWGDER